MAFKSIKGTVSRTFLVVNVHIVRIVAGYNTFYVYLSGFSKRAGYFSFSFMKRFSSNFAL